MSTPAPRHILDYYESRAPEYEAIYAKPERQTDLRTLKAALSDLVADEDVLELACGTGYWTRHIERTAGSITATDASAKLARMAAGSCASSTVRWEVKDAFDPEPCRRFSCIVAGFFYSHVPIDRTLAFLRAVANAAAPGTLLVLFDNRFVGGSNTPISETDESGNTFQMRILADGSRHRILKNFPDAGTLRRSLESIGDEVAVIELDYFWLASCRVRARDRAGASVA